MSDVTVSVENLSKRFKVYHNPWNRAFEWFRFGKINKHEDFWALRDISFQVNRGEGFAIIGPNGAGKSTLLKVITGALHQTSGTYSVKGRVLSLLELGTGFNTELTGRQNVINSARILGFPEGYLRNRMARIEAFAELGDFFERPIKTYSTGMVVRLAFSMFVYMEPQVLIVDEALSVGDIFFQQKCHSKIEKMLSNNTTFVLVTHDMRAVAKYCKKALLLNNGHVSFHGNSSEAINRYYTLRRSPASDPSLLDSSLSGFYNDRFTSKMYKHSTQNEISSWPGKDAFIDISSAVSIGEGWARCNGIALCDQEGKQKLVFKHGEKAYFYYEFEALQDLFVPFGVVVIRNDNNIIIHGKSTYQHLAPSFQHVKKGSCIRFRQCVSLHIRPEEYTFDIHFNMMKPQDYSNIEHMSFTDIQAKVLRLNGIQKAGTFCVVDQVGKGISLPHFGLCDLPGDCEIDLLHTTESCNTERDKSCVM